MKTVKFLTMSIVAMFLYVALANGAWAKVQQLCCGVIVIIDDTLECNGFPTPYPNPSSEGMHLHFYENVHGTVTIQATDANGNSIYEESFNLNGGGEVIIPCDTWENGIYVINVQENDCTRRITAEVYR